MSTGPNDPQVDPKLASMLSAGVAKGRVTFYGGVDCHRFFPKLLADWESDSIEAEKKGGDRQSPTSAVSYSRKAQLFRLSPLECDRPPSVDVWVGRDGELRSLETSKAKVVIFCGLGGEGKSVLASHYIGNLDNHESPYKLWDWRDCKEQSDRIRTQIVEVIVRFSHGSISADDLAEADEIELVDVLVDLTHDDHAILVFDNVDSYVDLENRRFTGLLDILTQKFSASNSNSRLILTCRPYVSYRSSSCITFTLNGLSQDEAIELFNQRVSTTELRESEIIEAHELTNGHAFWLDLLAVQVSNVPGLTLRKLLDDLRRGREDAPDILSSIWDTLALRERTLLRFMAEAVRPETENTISKFCSAQLTQKNFQKAFRDLISFNLIVVKPQNEAPDLYDLHPLVRSFVRAKFPLSERTDIIRTVINQYKTIIGALESLLGINLPFSMLERWSQKAELEVSAGMFQEAFETLSDIENAFIGAGHLQEYARVCRLLFESIDWETAATRYREFDELVKATIEALDQLGEFDAADNLISRYEGTIPEKTARYINLCDIRAYSFWQRHLFDPAIDWATRGVELKEKTKVDTNFDCSHNLALALRDGGEHEKSLRLFLKDVSLEDLLDESLAKASDGPLYGNVGRCLQLMGRETEALQCFRKSMRLLERDVSSHSRSNRSYARTWVGEAFAAKGQSEFAEAFFMDAIRILGSAAPVRVRRIYSQAEIARGPSAKIMTEAKSMRIVEKWLRQR
ncbi:NB-ARC domain-containing protein [Sulfitobacter sp.]|uniref:NB-ARC domain-containing protein n=1 Tax=Sulfitobacter sp. TaxID=1903071 RepID=UPI0040592EFB